MKKQHNIVFLLASVCCVVMTSFVAIGVLYAVIGRAAGWSGREMGDRVIYGVRSAGAQFMTDMYGEYAYAQPYGEKGALAPTEYGTVVTAYEKAPFWMRIPCGAWRATGLVSSPYAVEYQGKIYTLYDENAEVLNPGDGETVTIPSSDVPEQLRALTTNQVYGQEPLPAGVRRVAELAQQPAEGEKVLLQMDDYACANTFTGGLAAAAFFAIVAAAAWAYDYRRG